MELHAVIIRKPITLEKAREIANEFIKNKNRNFYRETTTSYRFRNLPKSRFSNFKAKKINKDITLVYGEPKIKAGGLTLQGLKGIFGNLGNKIQNFIIRYNPLSMALKASNPKIGNLIK